MYTKARLIFYMIETKPEVELEGDDEFDLGVIIEEETKQARQGLLSFLREAKKDKELISIVILIHALAAGLLMHSCQDNTLESSSVEYVLPLGSHK